MKSVGAWLLPLLLAACASGPTGDSPQAVCRRQAYDDPKVKHFMVEDIGHTEALDPSAQFDLDQALRNATDDCLRQKGVPVRGGVESVRP